MRAVRLATRSGEGSRRHVILVERGICSPKLFFLIALLTLCLNRKAKVRSVNRLHADGVQCDGSRPCGFCRTNNIECVFDAQLVPLGTVEQSLLYLPE